MATVKRQCLSRWKIYQLRVGHDFFHNAYGRPHDINAPAGYDYDKAMEQARADWLAFGGKMFDTWTGERADSSWWAWKQWGEPKKVVNIR